MRTAIVLCSLAGCQPAPSPVAPTPAQNLAQFTATDFANAIAIAQKSTQPQAPLIVSCFTFWNAQLAALQPMPQPSGTSSAGIATAFVVADLAASNLSSTFSPEGQVQYSIACGPLKTFLMNQGMTIGAQIASLGVLLAKP